MSKLEKEQLDRLKNISNQFKKFRSSAISAKLRSAFKTLEGKSASEVVKKINSLGQDKEDFKSYKAEVNKVLKLSKGREVNELEKMLDSLNSEYKSKLAQLKEEEKKVSKIKSKSASEISEEIKHLESLYQLIESGVVEDSKIDLTQQRMWEEIHSRVETQMRQERALWEKKSNLKATSRTAAGVKGIDLSETDEIVSVSSTYNGENMVLIVDESGRGKCTSLNEYRMSRWNSKGILSCKRVKEEEEGDNSRSFKNLVTGTLIDYEKDSLILWTEKGFLKRFKAREIVSTRKNRITSGNKLIELEKGDRIKKFAKWKNVEEEVKAASAAEG